MNREVGKIPVIWGQDLVLPFQDRLSLTEDLSSSD